MKDRRDPQDELTSAIRTVVILLRLQILFVAAFIFKVAILDRARQQQEQRAAPDIAPHEHPGEAVQAPERQFTPDVEAVAVGSPGPTLAFEAEARQMPDRIEEEKGIGATPSTPSNPSVSRPSPAPFSGAAVASGRRRTHPPGRSGLVSSRLPGGLRVTRSPLKLAAVLAIALLVASVFIPPVSSLWSSNLIIQGSVEGRGQGNQGCTPEYWSSHKDRWNGDDDNADEFVSATFDYTSQVQFDDRFNATFGVSSDESGHADSKTLRDVIRTGGPDRIELGRLAAGHLANADALENETLPGYRYTVADVIEIYVDAVRSTDDPGTDQNEHDDEIGNATGKLKSAQGDNENEGAEDAAVICPFDEDEEDDEGVEKSVPSSATAERPLTEFEEWAGIGLLPWFPGLCSSMTFDTVFVLEEPGAFEGAGTRDLIFGTTGDDDIDGGAGDDCISSDAGADSVRAGEGSDNVVAGAGDDVVAADGGADLVIGNEGHDSLDGGDDADSIMGLDGDDRIRGGGGDDAIDGGVGNDLCAGEGGDNKLAECEPSDGPLGLTGSYDAQTSSVLLTWIPASDAAYYKVYVSLRVDGEEGSGYVLEATSTSAQYTHTLSVANATYFYVVTSVDADGFESAPSNEFSIRIAELAMPGPTLTPPPTETSTAAAEPEPSPTVDHAAEPSPTFESVPETATPDAAGETAAPTSTVSAGEEP